MVPVGVTALIRVGGEHLGSHRLRLLQRLHTMHVAVFVIEKILE